MEIRVVRNSYESAAGYTHARLFVDEGGFLCWTLEPEDRGLHQDMPLTQIQARKVKGKTAIPTGRYLVKLLVSQKFKGRDYAKPYGGRFPTIMNVPGFSGILIHPGNTPADTSGCILPGMLQGSIRGHVFDSVKAYRDLMDFYIWPAYKRGEEIWINIY
jgi:hypothetical protein